MQTEILKNLKLRLTKNFSKYARGQLTLNIKKTNYIIFRPREKTIPFHPNIKFSIIIQIPVNR